MKKSITCLCALAVTLTLSPVPTATAAPPEKSVKKYSASKHSSRKKRKSRKKSRRSVFTCDQYSRKTLLRKSKRFSKTIHHASKKYGVNSNLIRAVIAVESCFNPRARGGLGEKGLMQLMPSTARQLGVKNGYSPWQNIHGGTKYLKQLLVRYKGNKRYAAAAYNGGPGAVSVKYGPKFKQVKRYSKHVMRAYNTLNRGKSERPAKLRKASLRKTKSKKYRSSKKKRNLKFSKARYKKTKYTKRYKKRKSKSAKRKRRIHHVKSGQTLYGIARKHRTSIEKLKRLNGLQSNVIHAGKKIRVH
ncbi:MAG: hypothetical protein CSB47_05295 [Proteobacteria bacterium]|nr:MAG: hypothetical protein CSB47_05295 [Pseudomonadota bacterium]